MESTVDRIMQQEPDARAKLIFEDEFFRTWEGMLGLKASL